MVNHLKKHGFTYFLIVCMLVFGLLFPDFSIDVSGGFAWLIFFLSNAIVLSMIFCYIFGGSIYFESEGLIPKIKRWRNKYKKDNINM
jgi:hypothetical protein